MKRKLILILPVDRHVVHFNAVAPPLGLGILAALTPSDWDIEIIDENFDTFVYKPADLVGITSWTVNINRAYEIAAVYKTYNIPVVMGGPHVTALPEEAAAYSDSVVAGNAETVWANLIDDFINNSLKPFYKAETTDTFVMPRHDLFHKDYILGAIQTTKGCPLHCDFCLVPFLNNYKYYRKNPDAVVEELSYIPQKFVFFIDDNLAGFSKAHEEETLVLFEKIIQSDIKKYWYSQTSINFLMNNNLLEKAARSGCGSLLIGFEADTEEALLSLNKKMNIKNNPANYNSYIQNAQKKGIAIIATSIFGLENDTPDSLEQRMYFLRNINASSITSTFLTPFPGTTLYKRSLENKKLVYSNYPHDWMYYNCQRVTCFPDGVKDAALFETYTRDLFLTAYTPLRLFERALRTLWQTRNVVALLHSWSANLKYRNFLKSKKASYYKLRLLVTRVLMGNKGR